MRYLPVEHYLKMNPLDIPLDTKVDPFNLNDLDKIIGQQHKGVIAALDNVTKVLQKISSDISVKTSKSTMAGGFVSFYFIAKNANDRTFFFLSVEDGAVTFVRKHPLLQAKGFRYKTARELQKTLATILVKNKTVIQETADF